MDLENDFRRELMALAARDRLRETKPFSGPDRAHPIAQDGTPLLSFCSNDYLGLAGHSGVAEAGAREAAINGFGASASRLVCGEGPSHGALESALADLVELPSALLFPTGYLANFGVLTALAGPFDLIASDQANHASIIDGCRLARSRIIVYPHLDSAAASKALSTPGSFRRRFLVTESLFSMDGDRAPLPALATIVAERGAALIVDEAHALGAVGVRGRGLCAELGIRPAVLIGTLGKAFASLGGFAAGSALLRTTLINSARSFIYSTGTPPAAAAAARTALSISASPDGDARRHRARALAETIRAFLHQDGLSPPGQDMIIPIILGSERRALEISSGLLQRRILVPAIRPPTVPDGTSRLRVTISAAHSTSDVVRLIEALKDLLPRA